MLLDELLMQKELLERVFAEHHIRKKRYGFIYGGEMRARLIARLVGSRKRVLDLGCRDGSLTQYYVDGNEVCGVDIDRQALDLCRDRLGIGARWADLNDPLPFDNETFDCVVAAELLEHILSPELLVEEAKRVLCPNGQFIGSVPNTFRLKSRLLFLLGREFDDPMHLHKFSQERIQQLLSRTFSSVQLLPLGGRILPIFPLWFAKFLVSNLSTLFCVDWVFEAIK
jgi:SAM-dependent methyltransferase